MTKKYLFGTDPEMFIWDVDTNRPISAHDIVPGSKIHPFKTKHGTVQPDGLAAEFNINPAESPEEFATNVMNVISDLRGIVNSKVNNAILLSSPTVTFGSEYISGLPEDVQALGCMPDYNAWTLSINDEPDGNGVDFRSGGFHLHVGYTDGESIHNPDHFADTAERVRQLEGVIYPASVLWDKDNKRRKLYGKMGAFRPKPYGFEWRSLSNSILRFKEEGLEWLVHTAKIAMEDYDDNVLYIEDGTIRNTLAKIAGDEITKDELIHYVHTYLPQAHGISRPEFIGY